MLRSPLPDGPHSVFTVDSRGFKSTKKISVSTQFAEGKSLFKTKGKKGPEPKWKASETRCLLQLVVTASQALKTETIGTVALPLQDVVSKTSVPIGTPDIPAYWFEVRDEQGKEVGELHLSLWWSDKLDTFKWFWYTLATQSSEGENLTKDKIESIFESINFNPPEELLRKCENSSMTVNFFIKYMIEHEEQIFIHPEMNIETAGEATGTDFIWQTVASCEEDDKIEHIVLHSVVDNDGKLLKGNTPVRDYNESIWIQDRKTGKIIKEKIPFHIKTALRVTYSSSFLRGAFQTGKGQNLLLSASERQGQKADSKSSVKLIQEFIKYHNLDMSVVKDPVESFKTFNEFFYREFDLTKRPIDPHPYSAVSPADCRLTVFESVDSAKELWIKGKGFSLKSLLENEEWEKMFEGCSLVIARLAPQDYHRFHFPVNGDLGTFVHQGHALYTVNPVAVRGTIDVFSLNKRISVMIDSPEFGKVLFISIGATMVGSVVLTSKENSTVKKGEEHGYFAFGGSTILLLFQKGKIIFDSDLLLNSRKKLETLVEMGMRIGIVPENAGEEKEKSEGTKEKRKKKKGDPGKGRGEKKTEATTEKRKKNSEEGEKEKANGGQENTTDEGVKDKEEEKMKREGEEMKADKNKPASTKKPKNPQTTTETATTTTAPKKNTSSPTSPTSKPKLSQTTVEVTTPTKPTTKLSQTTTETRGEG